MLHAARCKYRTQKSRQKSPSEHHHTTLSGCISATKAHIDNRKKLVSSNISSTCLPNMVNFGPLTAEIGSGVWGTPANFNGFRVLAALLHGTLVVGVSQTCGVEQRAPPIFDREATTLGTGPHSSFFGRPFAKRFALCYRTVVLSVLSVCNVGLLWPNGFIDQDET